MSNDNLMLAYTRLLATGGKRATVLEKLLAVDMGRLASEDEIRDFGRIFANCFDDTGRDYIIGLYGDLIRMMRNKSFEDSAEAIDGLMFLQEFCATALWRFDLVIGSSLEEFVRDFDRLDVESEKRRLHQLAQLV